MNKINLTLKQNAVIYCLQNGWAMITDMEMKGAIVCGNKFQFKITNRLFWNLVDKGLIYQGNWTEHRYNYVLTTLGKTIKTKPVSL